MCKEVKLLSKTLNGDLSFCNECNKYNLCFNNILFSLNKKEFQSLRRYINEIEASYWEFRYDCPKIKRKIPLPTKQDSLYLMFNNQEIEELRLLLNQKTDVTSSKLLSIGDIDYTLIAN